MTTMFKQRPFFGALAVAVIASAILSGCHYNGFNDPPAKATAGAANAYLLSKQQPDGGFEVAGFPGFETSDAILAVAENAQTAEAWNTTQARNAVANGVRSGKTPLNAIDDLAEGSITAGQAAKLIVLVAKPLGYSLTAFNPDGDGTVRNLVSIMNTGAQPNGSYGAFNATLYAAIAQKIATNAVPANTLTLIRGAQEASGGWDFSGTAAGADADVDTTALAVQALAAAGVAGTDTDLHQGLVYLANQYKTNGAFQSFGSNDPNSTSTAVLAITAAGYDPNVACWRNQSVPGLSGQLYTSPVNWLRSQQAADGHIVSPNDGGSPNTFATSQTVQALRRGFLPVYAVANQSCP
jgi:Prenyltransferase and squalene oxidase repeat